MARQAVASSGQTLVLGQLHHRLTVRARGFWIRIRFADCHLPGRPLPGVARPVIVRTPSTSYSGGPHGRGAGIGAPATCWRTSAQNARTLALTGSVSMPSTL